MDTYIRLTFFLPDRVTRDAVRKAVGALLRKSHLRYKSDNEFQLYRDKENQQSCRWALSFSLLPPTEQPSNHLETLRQIVTHDLYTLAHRHPEVADRVIYRNLYSFPHLTQLMQDWWNEE